MSRAKGSCKYQFTAPRIEELAKTLPPSKIAIEVGLHHSEITRIGKLYGIEFPHKRIRAKRKKKDIKEPVTTKFLFNMPWNTYALTDFINNNEIKNCRERL